MYRDTFSGMYTGASVLYRDTFLGHSWSEHGICVLYQGLAHVHGIFCAIP